MAVVSMPMMLGPILGPVVGGVILQNLHWSWIFFVNVPIGIVAFVARRAHDPAPRLRRGRPTRCARPRALPHGARGDHLRGLATGLRGCVGLAWRAAPDRGGRGARARLLRARAARRASPARHPPLLQPRLRGRLADDLLRRLGALRRDDPRAPLLPGSPPRERHRHGPAERSSGPRRARRDAARQPPHGTLRRREGDAGRRERPLSELYAACVHRRLDVDRRDLARSWWCAA